MAEVQLDAASKAVSAEPHTWYDFGGNILDFMFDHLGSRCRVDAAHLADPSSLPGARDVVTLLNNPFLRSQAVRVVTDGVTQPATKFSTSVVYNSRKAEDSLDSRALRRAFAEGSTVVVEDVGRWHPPVAAICNQIFNDRWLYANAAYFMTGALHGGFPFHADEEITFIFQLSGTKLWHVADHPAERLGSTEVPADERVIEFALRPGDAACVPPMYPHRTQTLGEGDSLHLTVGVRPFKVKDLFSDLAERGLSRIPALEREIPTIDSLRQALSDALSDASGEAWKSELAIASLRLASGAADRGFELTSSTGSVVDETASRDLMWRVRLGEQSLVYFSGAFARVDDAAADALEAAIAERKSRGCTWRELVGERGLPAALDSLLEAAGWSKRT